ncbi:MAG: tetratricopeptide repeat protein [Planctomycetaceae bacterium]
MVLLVLLSGCTGTTDSPEVTFEKGRMLSDRGRFEDAVPLFTSALKEMPDRPEVFYERGRSYENLELFEKALEDYSACLSLDPEFVQAINNKGVVLARMKRLEEAGAEFTRLIARDPRDVLALRNRGLCFHDLEEYDQALADYNKAIEIAATDAENWFQRGNVYLEQDKLAEAIADYSKAIELDPQFAKAWMNRGVAQFGLNDRKAAVSDLQKAQELDDSIILPGLDWANIDNSPAGDSVSASKPVFPESTAADWTSVLATALVLLEQRDFEDLTVRQADPRLLTGILNGQLSGKPVEVYVGVVGSDSETATLPPVGPASEAGRVLIVLKPTGNGDDSYDLAEFQPEWSPEASDLSPTAVSYKIRAE